MRKAAEQTAGILKGLLFIGFSIQAFLGISWMCLNFFHLQDFGRPDGLLYPVIRERLSGVYPLIYLGQLGLAACAAHVFLQSLRRAKGLFAVWRVAVLLTFPMAAQCHLAVSPYSAACSLFLLELSLFMRLLKERGEEVRCRLLWMGLLWLLLTLLLPEYILLAGAPFVAAVLIVLCRAIAEHERKCAVKQLLLAAGIAGLLWVVCSLSGAWENPYSCENLALSLFSRVAWQNMVNDLGAWPQEVQEVFGKEAAEIYRYADNVREVAEPLMDAAFGKEEKTGYYLEMARISWSRRATVVIRQTGGDALGYAAAPLLLPMQLNGRGYDSYSGRNYEMLINAAPKQASGYIRYSCGWFCAMLLLTLLLRIALRISGRRTSGREAAAVAGCVTALGLTVVVYTLRGAGLMDYKCTVAMNLFWLAAALWSMDRQSGYEVGEVKDGDVGNSDFGVVSAADCCSDAGRRNI